MAIKATDFILVPDELHSAVVTYGNWLVAQGYTVKLEPYDLEYPASPVFRAIRMQGQAYFIEVASTVNIERAEEWVKYGRASSQDTRYVVVVPDKDKVSMKDFAKLQQLGVGVEVIDGSSVRQLCAAHDLSLNIEFPLLSKKLQRKLGNAKDLFSQGHWKEGFEDACQALESEAREYLIKAVRSGRATFVTSKGKPIAYTEVQISKMPLGALARAFGELVGPSQTESRIALALARINPRRITVAHFKHKSGKRANELRTQVGKDLIVIVNAMKMLIGV